MRTTTISAEQIQQQLSGIWEQSGSSIHMRLVVLELAADMMARVDATRRMNPEIDARARAEAHAIHGELSTFGFNDAARISAEIDALFRDSTRRNKSEASLLFGLILMLRLELDEITTTPRGVLVTQQKLR